MKKIIYIFTALLAFIYSGSTLALSDEELLPPEQAFSVNASTLDANTVQVEWTIAKGYYIYRDRVSIESTTPGIELGKPVFPQGEMHQTIKPDGTEGKVEVYFHTLKVNVPIKRLKAGLTSLSLNAKSQGCAQAGVCYPPLSQKVLLNLPATAAAATNKADADGFKPLTKLGDSLGLDASSQDEFLSPDQAFKLTTRVIDPTTIEATWQIAPHHYLYQEKFNAKVLSGDGVTLGKLSVSKGEIKHDKILNKTLEVHHNSATATIQLNRTNPAAQTIKMQIGYQGCSEAGICYPPQKKMVAFDLPAAGASNAVPETATPTEQSTAAAGSYLTYILAAFGIGLLLTFTPCVLPMIPILSSIIVGQSQDGQITKLKGGMLSLSYVLGTAVVYSAAGWVAGSSGKQLQAYFQNPYVIGGVSGILVLLAMSMFGLFTIQMPTSIQSRLQEKSSGIQGGSLVGVFIMGILSSMIVGACASPVLLSVLGVAIKAQDPLLGALIMFAMSLGMGIVLIAIGVGAGFLIPKAGTWMDSVKYFFGVLLLGVAIYILHVLPAVPVLLLWGGFFIVLSIYLGATQTLPETASGWKVFWKGIGTVLLVWGILSLVGGIQGNRDPLQPIDFSKLTAISAGPAGAPAVAEDAHELFTHVASLADLQRELDAAKAAGKPVMIDFFATWCTECIRFEQKTFKDPTVQQTMKNFATLQVNVTDPDDPGTSAVQKKLGVFAPPAILFFKADGTANKAMDFYGFKEPDEFVAHLQKAMQN
jgi:thiol:disulfide interchange protein DsbD